jgi:hypothetical protein
LSLGGKIGELQQLPLRGAPDWPVTEGVEESS